MPPRIKTRRHKRRERMRSNRRAAGRIKPQRRRRLSRLHLSTPPDIEHADTSPAIDLGNDPSKDAEQ